MQEFNYALSVFRIERKADDGAVAVSNRGGRTVIQIACEPVAPELKLAFRPARLFPLI